MGSKNQQQTTQGSTNQTIGALTPFGGQGGYLANAGQQVSNLANQNPANYVAPFSAPQQQAFGIAQAQANSGLSGLATPDLGLAQGAYAGAAPITTSSILQNYSPYIGAQNQAFLDYQNQLNQQNLQGVQSQAAQAGILSGGGNRAQVASDLYLQSALPAEQAAGAANLQQGFQNAQQLAGTNQQAALQQGAGYANLGTTAQNTGLGNVNELLGIGGTQQAQQQSLLNAPLTLAQWQSGILPQLSSAFGSNQAGNTTSTTTTPINPYSAIGGLGLGVLGLAGSNLGTSLGNGLTNIGSGVGSLFGFKRGGGVKGYDDGGAIGPLLEGDPVGDVPALMQGPGLGGDFGGGLGGGWDTTITPSLAEASGPQVTSEGEEVPTSGIAPVAHGRAPGIGYQVDPMLALANLGFTAAANSVGSKGPLGAAVAFGKGGQGAVANLQAQNQLAAQEAYRNEMIKNRAAALGNQAERIANQLQLGQGNLTVKQGQLGLNQQKVAQGFGQGQTIQIMKMLQQEDPSLSNEAALDKAKRGPQNNDVAWERVIQREAADSGQPIDQVRQRVRGFYGLPAPTPVAPVAPVPNYGQQSLPGMAGGGSVHLDKAREAIAKGADPAAVRQRLQEMGIDHSGL